MTQQEQMEQPEKQPPSITVGMQLREARVAQNLAIEKVAKQLYLDVATLQALENDDDSHLPEPIFVRGYIQNYSRLLGIDVEPLLASYNACAPSEPKLEGTGPNAAFTRPQVHSHGRSQKTMGWMPLLMFVVIVGGIAAIWAYWPLSLSSLVTSDDETLVQEGVLTLPESTAEALSVEPEPALSLSEAPQVEFIAPSEVVEEIPAVVTPVAVEPILPVVDSVVLDRLVLKGDSESWVTIHDDRGERLMYGMLKSGVTREIEGVAPFRVLLGYARGVELSINDEPFDVTPHIKENSARFIVDRTN